MVRFFSHNLNFTNFRFLVKQYDIPKSVDSLKQKLREEFRKNDHLQDIRVIDMLVVKVCNRNVDWFPTVMIWVLQGQMELKETVNFWKQKGTFMSYFKDTVEPKPKDFLSKFLSGHN